MPTTTAANDLASEQPAERPDLGFLDDLRRQIRAIERGAPVSVEEETVSLGAAEIDAALPWQGLPVSGLHEIAGDAAALGFSAALLARLATGRPGAPVLWCQPGRDLSGHGLAAFGLDPSRLIVVHARNDNDILWAMEEGLRCCSLAAVLGRVKSVPPIAGRRLQLAAETNKTTGFLLRPQEKYTPTSAAMTRWHVLAAPSSSINLPSDLPGIGAPQWQVALQRCRLAKPQSWQVEWCDETRDLTVVADIRNRQAEPEPLRAIAG